MEQDEKELANLTAIAVEAAMSAHVLLGEDGRSLDAIKTINRVASLSETIMQRWGLERSSSGSDAPEIVARSLSDALELGTMLSVGSWLLSAHSMFCMRDPEPFGEGAAMLRKALYVTSSLCDQSESEAWKTVKYRSFGIL